MVWFQCHWIYSINIHWHKCSFKGTSLNESVILMVTLSRGISGLYWWWGGELLFLLMMYFSQVWLLGSVDWPWSYTSGLSWNIWVCAFRCMQKGKFAFRGFWQRLLSGFLTLFYINCSIQLLASYLLMLADCDCVHIKNTVVLTN